ncbi:Uma2 family endonuclease [filamentous cyanobacterium LEGE 11480]|uniref:Uma2 family endonuclease n=1 Tax=Romeriopsis navalis LEGE 11480 TaxID=2777977 RepID=A0A928VNR3_9CYAN|nr:Uma2 family endonuclease [Romeriopsis navalis]MBE9029354.1 Uma2 family endonuclease [Romeriopsis navalis LEGE 11480]
MTAQIRPTTAKPAVLQIDYPDSDGQPMADNTRQFAWIVKLKEGLESLFQADPQVFVAGDLLWYPVEGDNRTRRAPDAMVVFGRPKGDRGSYRQWEEDNIAPQVVFEILSPGNTLSEMALKLEFYGRYGVEEYYLYDPDRNDLTGWLRDEGGLAVIETMVDWVSPRLGIRFDLSGAELEVIRPDGECFKSYVELVNERDAAAQERDAAVAERDRLAAKLRELGIDPEQLG